MDAFAEHIIGYANRTRGGISNLELQKVMYLSLGEYIARQEIDDVVLGIYTEPFEHWTYGPVIPTLFRKYNETGRYFIKWGGGHHIERDIYSRFNPYIHENLKCSVTEMVQRCLSHESWMGNRQAILSKNKVTISLEEISRDFKRESTIEKKGKF